MRLSRIGHICLAPVAVLLAGPTVAQQTQPPPPLFVVPTVWEPPGAVATEHPSEAVPLDPPNRWISSSRYPASAHASGQEGVVQFRLTIDSLGRVTDCVLTRQTGFAALDDIVCPLLRREGRFRPATNAEGRNVEGTYVGVHEFEVRRERMPQAGSATMEFTVRPDGTLSDCSLTRDGEELRLGRDPCEGAEIFQPYRDSKGEVVAVRVRSEQKITVTELPEQP